MQTLTGRFDLADPLYDVLGYDHSEQKVRIGALAENTHPQIRSKIEDMLQERRGFSSKEAKAVVMHTWRDTPDDMKIKLVANLATVFEKLQEEDIKIAVCTSDSREGTEAFLESERLHDLVDVVVCGDDAVNKPKPDPHNVGYICKEIGASPSETIMVGDTPADTLMGQQAGVGLTVGVLSGVGTKSDLADADIIVDNVHECVEMILPHEKSADVKVHQVTMRGLFKIARAGDLLNGHNRRAFSTSSTSTASEVSHVIVGAGSAGCVLANRLTEDRSGNY